MDKKDKKGGWQLSIEEILKKLRGEKEKVTSKDLSRAIEDLAKARKTAAKQEEEEKKRKEEEEARQKKEAEEETFADPTCMDLPLDWENVFDNDERTKGVKAETPADALILSQIALGRVDIEYMASITGLDYKTVIQSLKGSIYQNPETWDECFYKGWETADEYLTGNLMKKWNAAADANLKYNGYFKENMLAIEKVLPPSVATKDIYVTLGSPWVPPDIIDDFIVYLLGKSREIPQPVKHDEVTGTWDIPQKSRYFDNANSYSAYGTPRMSALHILERTLNMRTIVVKDKVYSPVTKSGDMYIVNKQETAAALEKQRLIIEKFKGWVWRNKERKDRLTEIFEYKFSSVRSRRFDGSFLTFPTMNKDVELFSYQKDAVARILFSKNTLLAHDVGSGKTYVMIAAAMELRRMGLSKKNLFVVPNNLVGQWQDVFKEMYPQAKLLCVEPKHFTPKKRAEVLTKIRDEEFDGIIMAYSCFDMIPLSWKSRLEKLKEEKRELEELSKQKGKDTSGVARRLKSIEKNLVDMLNSMSASGFTIDFDELNITRLFVDEAHNYKNVPLDTNIVGVLGLGGSGSSKCESMMEKVHYLQRMNDGGGVVFATGTPITNSLADAFVMQKYLQSGELAALELQSFDAWIGMFAETATEFEVDVDTSSYRLATRFSRFHNLPELTVLLSSIADFHSTKEGKDLPKINYHDSLIARTEGFVKYLEEISRRADDVRRGRVRRTKDNMLKITTDGRKAALDLRLVDKKAGFTYSSKVARCAENVSHIYFMMSGSRSAQLVFCDTSTPKDGFNIYDELRRLLEANGVDGEEIAYVHDATSEKKRDKMFEQVRKGAIRVLIGSTFKLGLGVNVQDKLVAVHHLDVPWRPADMVQREGRIIRQGNENKEVSIFRYITEGSFDAYSWQLLETKQNFIAAVLDGSIKERSGSDVDDTVLSYAEIKAIAIGNPLVKQRVETANELNRCLALQRKAIDNRHYLEKRLESLPERIEDKLKKRTECRADMVTYLKERRDYTVEERKFLREEIFSAVQGYAMEAEDKELFAYQGFTIILPANMLPEKPYVYLRGKGKYAVDLGDTEKGVIVRLDNFLDELPDMALMLTDDITELRLEEKRIKQQLEKAESYSEKIEELKAEIKRLDKELGVEENE